MNKAKNLKRTALMAGAVLLTTATGAALTNANADAVSSADTTSTTQSVSQAAATTNQAQETQLANQNAQDQNQINSIQSSAAAVKSAHANEIASAISASSQASASAINANYDSQVASQSAENSASESSMQSDNSAQLASAQSERAVAVANLAKAKSLAQVNNRGQATNAAEFFQDVANDPQATSEQKEDAQNAYAIVTGGTYGEYPKPSWYDQRVHLSRDGDATSISAMRQALKIYSEFIKYRQQKGLTVPKISLTAVAVAMVDADYSVDGSGHANYYYSAENLAWPFEAAMPGWAGEETTWNQAAQHNPDLAAHLNDHTAWVARNYPDFYQHVGHYLNLINTDISSYGMAVCLDPNSEYGSVASFDSNVAPSHFGEGMQEGLYTFDQYQSLLNKFAKSSDSTAVIEAQNQLDTATKKFNDLQQSLTQKYNDLVKTDQAKIDTINSNRQAALDALKQSNNEVATNAVVQQVLAKYGASDAQVKAKVDSLLADIKANNAKIAALQLEDAAASAQTSDNNSSQVVNSDAQSQANSNAVNSNAHSQANSSQVVNSDAQSQANSNVANSDAQSQTNSNAVNSDTQSQVNNNVANNDAQSQTINSNIQSNVNDVNAHNTADHRIYAGNATINLPETATNINLISNNDNLATATAKVETNANGNNTQSKLPQTGNESSTFAEMLGVFISMFGLGYLKKRRFN